MSPPAAASDWEGVESLEDFAAYLKLLSEDFEATAKRDSWGERRAHETAGAFLEAFGAWLEDGYLRPGAAWADQRPEPSWREFAGMFWVARGYE